MANNKVKFLRGTSSEYTAAEKDNDTIYFTTDDGKLYIGNKEVSGSDITIDNALSETSENPVQNKVIKTELDKKAEKTVATTETDGLMSAADKAKLDETRLWRRCVVGQSTSATTNPYYKFASISLSNKYADAAITFKVSKNYADRSTYLGILAAHVRTSGAAYWDYGELVWEYALSGIDTSKFILCHNTSTKPTVVELWVKADEPDMLCHFDVLTEGTRTTSNNSLWTLYNKVSAGSEAALPSGYVQQTSTLGMIKNSISGNAATATNASKVNNHSVESDVPADAKFTDTNTWRDVVDNLTSTDATKSLSANQGKVLKGLVDGKAAASHTHSAYVNQNAFSNVVVGSTTVAADSATDTLTLIAGSNITITPDATNDKITIAAKDTTYGVATQSKNGLMSATDKAILDKRLAYKLVSSSCQTVTINVSDWNTLSSGGYACEKTLPVGLLYDNYIFDVSLSSETDAAKLQLQSWNYIMADGRIEQATSSINGEKAASFTFYAFTTKPTVALTIAIQGVSGS